MRSEWAAPAARGQEVKARDIIRELEADGWRKVRQESSHRHLQHPTKLGTITISQKDGDDLAAFIVKKIRKQAGL